MFVGHFGLGLAAKKVAPRISLGTLFLSVQLADGLWPIFLLVGREHVHIVPHLMKTSHLNFWDYPWSHSLLALAVWGALFGAVSYVARRLLFGAILLAAGVVSHWFLDALMHRPDMPLKPGGPYVGLGLWNSLPATLAIEGGLYAAGILLYLRATRPRDAAGDWSLAVLLVFLASIWIWALVGPPPPSEKALAWSALSMWLVVPWGYWIDRHRIAAGTSAG